MPPNRTPEIQPLDVGMFGAMQAMTNAGWQADEPTDAYLARFQRAWEQLGEETVRSAFYKAIAVPEGRLEDSDADERARAGYAADQQVDAALADFMAFANAQN